ncbi:hypothetical protein LY78DRAFT_678439 [Colletotrichum sublineola]|nr:hypothetical protein LY78DRAFT_678439 [Colletotrichum sublineola]
MHSVYQHLPQGCIRLLTLHPDDASAKLLCTLQSTSLESAPEYEAVSYAWGDPKVSQIPSPSRPAQTRKTYQAVVSITPNVTSLLQSLRRADGPRVLWIDAICINQVDISERNVQVQQMRSIYTRAIRTVIWLGTATEDGTSDLALAFLSKMAAYQRYLHWTRSEVSFYEEGDEDYAFETSLFDQDTDAGAGRAEHTGIYMSRFILPRDWVREWVVEIRWKVMSRYGYYFTLRYWNLVERRRRNQRREGGKAASRDNDRRVSHVALGIPILYENDMDRFFHERYHGHWAAIDQLLGRPWWSRAWVCTRSLERKLEGDTPMRAADYQVDDIPEGNVMRLIDGKLSDLLWNTWARDAQDPRDKVFAVLGLVSRNEGLLNEARLREVDETGVLRGSQRYHSHRGEPRHHEW